jgi:hypothetical protein
MKSESLSNLKKEILSLPPELVVQYCIRMAKYKSENKELLSYLIYQAYDQQTFIQQVKGEIDHQFKNLNKSNLYFAKKTIRKALKTTYKFIKFSGIKQTELDLLIHFCKKLKASGLPLQHGKVLGNIYQRQFERINAVLSTLHEDLQLDYASEIKIIS